MQTHSKHAYAANVFLINDDDDDMLRRCSSRVRSYSSVIMFADSVSLSMTYEQCEFNDSGLLTTRMFFFYLFFVTLGPMLSVIAGRWRKRNDVLRSSSSRESGRNHFLVRFSK